MKSKSKSMGITIMLMISLLVFNSTMKLYAGEEESPAEAEQAEEAATEEEFQPGGRPLAKVYFNFHQPVDGSGGARGFELKRAYLGYQYHMTENFYMKINVDAGKAKIDLNDSVTVSSSLHYTAYMKNAYMNYTRDRLSLSVGLIGMANFKIQEKFWGHRYLYKSLQDEHKIAPSADLGFRLDYAVHDKFSLDFSIRNGEGYKLIQMDEYLNYGLGATLKPSKELVLRMYYDYSNHGVARSVLTGFAGYKIKNLSLAAEYNYLVNEKYKAGQNMDGLSLFSSLQLGKRFELFARYDRLSSVSLDAEQDPWNIYKDGSAYIGGLQFAPFKGFKAALNLQAWDAAREGEATEAMLFLNFEYAFK